MKNFDVNATFGVDPDLKDRVFAVTQGVLNPSSVHQGGQRARALVEQARDSIRQLLGLSSSKKVIFTSGATEANNLALSQILGKKNGSLIISNIEHPSIQEYAALLESKGTRVVVLDVKKSLVTQMEQQLSTENSNPSLVSIMWANNETGQLIDVSSLTADVKNYAPNTIFHSDIVQAFGKLDQDFAVSPIDMFSVSGHKLGAFPGVGALIVNNELEITPLVVGGPQETHLRAGTENILGIVSFGIRAQELQASLEAQQHKMLQHRDHFESSLVNKIPDLEIAASLTPRLPNTSCFRIPGIRGDDLVVAMDLRGVCISSGAACASGKPDPSPVMLALGYSEDTAKEFVRVSFSGKNSVEEIDSFIALLVSYINNVRSTDGAYAA